MHFSNNCRCSSNEVLVLLAVATGITKWGNTKTSSIPSKHQSPMELAHFSYCFFPSYLQLLLFTFLDYLSLIIVFYSNYIKHSFLLYTYRTSIQCHAVLYWQHLLELTDFPSVHTCLCGITLKIFDFPPRSAKSGNVHFFLVIPTSCLAFLCTLYSKKTTLKTIQFRTYLLYKKPLVFEKVCFEWLDSGLHSARANANASKLLTQTQQSCWFEDGKRDHSCKQH